MNHVLFCILFSIALPAFAEKPPVLHVEQIDPMVDIDQMKAKNVQVHKLDETDADEWVLPTPEARDAMLNKAGLKSLTESWDHYDLDKFFLNAKSLELKKFQKKYPDLEKAKLRTYSKLAKKTKLVRR